MYQLYFPCYLILILHKYFIYVYLKHLQNMPSLLDLVDGQLIQWNVESLSFFKFVHNFSYNIIAFEAKVALGAEFMHWAKICFHLVFNVIIDECIRNVYGSVKDMLDGNGNVKIFLYAGYSMLLASNSTDFQWRLRGNKEYWFEH